MSFHLPSWLEEGRLPSRAGANLLSSAWAAWMSRELARPIPTPPGTKLVTVGGATLGGSGKTPLAIALARAIARRGESVVLVGHAHGAKPGRAKIVRPDDDVREVGDEALVAARALEGTGAKVIVAESRANAVLFAAKQASLLVLDGPLQARPKRALLSLLAVDAENPWGSGRCPPLGDLRADRVSLLSACDAVVAIGKRAPSSTDFAPRPVIHAPASIDHALTPSGDRVALEHLRTLRLGLLLGIARPSRLRRALEDDRIVPRCELRFGDHRLPTDRLLRTATDLAREHELDAWLATEKCRTRLPSHVGNVPVVVIKQSLEFSDEALTQLGFG